VVCPADASDESDMRSILAILAIESVAPQVRTVVEVNNPKHVERFRRAGADEILVTSQVASRLLARTSLYPGLSELVTDIVSGGEGSELYRVTLPEEYMGMSIDALSTQMRSEHEATLLAVTRDAKAYVNSAAESGDGDQALRTSADRRVLAGRTPGTRCPHRQGTERVAARNYAATIAIGGFSARLTDRADHLVQQRRSAVNDE
jgi:Trk K+ transport system NAD-binding subunit